MSDVYSPALGLAFACAIGAVLLEFSRSRIRSVWAAVAALALVVVAVLSHVFLGHAPGSASAQGLLAFVAEHPALLVATGIAVLALAVARGKRS